MFLIKADRRSRALPKTGGRMEKVTVYVTRVHKAAVRLLHKGGAEVAEATRRARE